MRKGKILVRMALGLLMVILGACDSLLPPLPTRAPTGRPLGAEQVLSGVPVPPTWTATRPPLLTFTPVAPSATATQYLRTVTPTWPSRTPTNTATPTNTPTPTRTATPLPTIPPENVWMLDEYPRPADDNGWGMHWFSTYQQTPEVVDQYVEELKRMHIRWLVFLNDGTDIGRNDYLVQRLVEAGIMPVMRLYVHGVVPYDGNLGAVIRHYRAMGVYYFQLYNEPNLYAEAAGKVPNPDWYISHWAPAAEVVLFHGGLPGIGALSPGGEYDDLAYLRGALQSLKRRDQAHLLHRGWLSVHNYANYQPVESTAGFLRFRLYNQIVVEELGHMIPILGTEAGHYGDISEQFVHVSGEYRYLAGREDYLFCHSYWLIGNQIGGSWDSGFEYQVLFHADGTINPLVTGLFYRGP